MKRYLYSQTAQVVSALCLILALALFWQFVISEEKAIFADSSAKLNDERYTIRGMERQLGRTTRVVDRYRNNIDEIQYFRTKYLQQKDERLVNISRFLEEHARKRGLRMEQVGYHAALSREKDLEIQQIALPLKGSYRNIRAFIRDVEGSDLFLIINELTMEDENARGGVVEVELTLVTYFAGIEA